MKKAEWVGLYIFAGTIDLVQFLADLFLTEFFALPEIASAALDPFIGGGIAAYLHFRGVSIFSHFGRLASLLGVVGLEEVTGGFAPAFILDVWYIHKSVKREEEEYREQQEQAALVANITHQPLYQNGLRQPAASTKTLSTGPKNTNGFRRPHGGLVK